MKINNLSVLLLAPVFMLSCSGEKANPGGDSAKTDTGMVDITRPAGEDHLEALLAVKDEAELKSKFGADHVKYDTIWGPEGSYDMGSYIDKGTKDEVQIYWKDSLHRSGVATVSVHARYHADGSYDFSGKWFSESGVKLGMTTGELEKLNGKSFSFSGFGWDYGGGVMGWNKGKLDNYKVGVGLTEGTDLKST